MARRRRRGGGCLRNRPRRIDGVQVRYREEIWSVTITVAGALPAATLATIVEDARAKLAELERSSYVARRLDA